jgi:hypothetical protein
MKEANGNLFQKALQRLLYTYFELASSVFYWILLLTVLEFAEKYQEDRE